MSKSYSLTGQWDSIRVLHVLLSAAADIPFADSAGGQQGIEEVGQSFLSLLQRMAVLYMYIPATLQQLLSSMYVPHHVHNTHNILQL